ncbi:MAG: DUF721 domain-containing protein [Alphaproteobacteria bacterium]|nr:DUF721 domain-containing protein [Alphaproteobacteria bacterium]
MSDDLSDQAPRNLRHGRKPGLRALAGLAPRLIDPLLRKRGFVEGRIVRDWASIVGPELAGVCAPEKLAFARDRRGGGTLTLRVVSGRALELQHRTPQLIERLNAHFGWAAVGKVSLRQGPLPVLPPSAAPPVHALDAEEKASVAQRVATVRDDDLRERLAALGEALAARRPVAEK